MAQQQSVEEVEDGVIRRVWAITLNAQQADASASPPVLHLAGLAKVGASAQGGAAAWLSCRRSCMRITRGNQEGSRALAHPPAPLSQPGQLHHLNTTPRMPPALLP